MEKIDRTARRQLAAGAAAAAVLAAVALGFLALSGPHTIGTSAVLVSLAALLAVCATGLGTGRKWAPVLACGSGVGFLVATLDITVLGYRTFPPVKFLLLLPALYLGSLPALPAVRTFFGHAPLTHRSVRVLVSAVAVLAVLVVGGYFSFINARVPSVVTRLRTEPYQQLEKAFLDDGRAMQWDARYNGVLPADGDTVEETELAAAVKTGPGEMVRLTRAMTFWDFDYRFFGYDSIYNFEKALWNAGYSQPALLMIKSGLCRQGVRAYHLDGPGVRALVHLYYDTEDGTWIVKASIYQQGDLGATYLSMSPIMGRALAPVVKTILMVQEGGEGSAAGQERKP